MLRLTVFICIYHLLFSSHLAMAEQKKQVGPYEIHYMALKSTFLSSEMARYYKINRGSYTGIINISIINTNHKSRPAVHAKVNGYVFTMNNQKHPLVFKKLLEGRSIYYIAEFPHEHEDQLNFSIDIQGGDDLSTQINFEQVFFVY